MTISTRSLSILRSALSSLLVGALAAPGAALAVRPAGALEAAGTTPAGTTAAGTTAAGTTPAGTTAAGTTPGGTTPVAAARVARRSRSCQVRLESASEEAGAGDAATLTGMLTCEELEPTTGQTISIYEHERGTPGSSVIGSATAEASGAFHFTTEALESDSSFYAVAEDGARSERVSLRVLSRVTIGGSPEGGPLSSAGGHAAASTRTGRTVTFTGTVAPAEVGAGVALQRQGTGDEGSWHTIARGHVGAEGEYSITHTFGIPGTVNVRVLVRVHGHLPAISQTLSYTVARGLGAQLPDSRRPALTASVSGASVQEGEPVTFSGTLTPSHPGQLVYLERQDPNPLRFHVVGSAPVAEDGSFSIEQTLTGVGTQVFRLAVHAAPGSRPVASGALSVLVTAAP